MNCDHFWRTIERAGYGWVDQCEKCRLEESAEHTKDCFDFAVCQDKPCVCGAEGKFQQFLRRKPLIVPDRL